MGNKVVQVDPLSTPLQQDLQPQAILDRRWGRQGNQVVTQVLIY